MRTRFLTWRSISSLLHTAVALSSRDILLNCTALLMAESGLRSSWASIARNSFLRMSAALSICAHFAC